MREVAGLRGTSRLGGELATLGGRGDREWIEGAFSHSANYYGDYPGNNPENHPPAESCTINSKLKNSNI